jgi:Ni/Co efflux regulator RcnB
MKRVAIAALAALTFATPVLAAGTAAADPPHHSSYDRNDRHDRNDRRDDRRSGREGYRSGRWDSQRYNGYNYRGQWHYGPPPEAYYGRRDFELGLREWRRGDRLPSYYRSRYRPVDYRHYRLREPPRGYHYVRDDRGELLLVGVTTGIILSIIAGGY